ncbi:hypothetical protein GEV33_006620 [Tenebrio molitor]|uniref:Uncharacterized protein n=1 Tax=Tenebrio molitor TaxID=7067 RepID=A0A8J6LJI7_TENMO|nr:hypothetical protein GEV33_006620 [Tenebrio molitor]
MKSVACEIRIEATTFKQNCFCSSITNAKQRANVNRTSCWPQRQSGDRDESRAARCALRIQCQLRARHTIHRYDKSPVKAEHGYASTVRIPDDLRSASKRPKNKKSQGNRTSHNELEKNSSNEGDAASAAWCTETRP